MEPFSISSCNESSSGVSSSSCTGNFNSSKVDQLKELSCNCGHYDAVKKNNMLRSMNMKKSKNRIPERSNVKSLKCHILDTYNDCSTADSAVYCEKSLEKYYKSNQTLNTEV